MWTHHVNPWKALVIHRLSGLPQGWAPDKDIFSTTSCQWISPPHGVFCVCFWCVSPIFGWGWKNTPLVFRNMAGICSFFNRKYIHSIRGRFSSYNVLVYQSVNESWSCGTCCCEPLEKETRHQPKTESFFFVGKSIFSCKVEVCLSHCPFCWWETKTILGCPWKWS